ncbi:MAG: YdeI/OmpD-associated family protein [Gemmatimonadaceae bacterium]
MTTQRFKTVVSRSGTRTLLAIPFNPDDVWGVKQLHHVTGSVSGCNVRGALVTDGTRFFLPLGAAWRRDNRIVDGAQVDVVLSPEGPQYERLSPDIADALDAAPQAKAFFEALASFYRNTYIKWIESAKRPETRSARIAEMVKLLKAGKKEK